MTRLGDIPNRIPRVVLVTSQNNCRTCNTPDPSTAPSSCTACAYRRAQEAERKPMALAHVLADSRERAKLSPRAALLPILERLRAGQIRDGRFYVWVDNGGGEVHPLADGPDGRRRFVHTTVESAEAAGREAVRGGVAAAWIVTVSGLWQVTADDAKLR